MATTTITKEKDNKTTENGLSGEITQMVELLVAQKIKEYPQISALSKVEDTHERVIKIESSIESLQKEFNPILHTMDKRFGDMDKRFEDMNKRFSFLQWVIIAGFSALAIGFSALTFLIGYFEYMTPLQKAKNTAF